MCVTGSCSSAPVTAAPPRRPERFAGKPAPAGVSIAVGAQECASKAGYLFAASLPASCLPRHLYIHVHRTVRSCRALFTVEANRACKALLPPIEPVGAPCRAVPVRSLPATASRDTRTPLYIVHDSTALGHGPGQSLDRPGLTFSCPSREPPGLIYSRTSPLLPACLLM